PKIMFGTSSNNPDIAPEFYTQFDLAITPQSVSGLIITPSVTYRRFRIGSDETQPAIEFAKYFTFSGDNSGYYVVQGRGSVSFNSSPDKGYSVGGGLQTVRANGLTLGVWLEGGRITYDSIIGTGVETDYYAARPSIGFRFANKYEVFVRGDYTHTQFYNIS